MDHPYEIGKGYFIRTVTYHYTGLLKKVYPQELVLTEAAWIADDGRFAQAMAGGEFSEVEPYPADIEVIINRSSVIDACKRETLPRKQK